MEVDSVRELVGRPEMCSYLPDRRSLTRYRIIEQCSPQRYSALLRRGWRRFGRVFFRPACFSCLECVSLRVLVDQFRWKRSLRRNARRNEDLDVEIGAPRIDDERLDLYSLYHRDMADRKGWPCPVEVPAGVDDRGAQYAATFVDGGGDFARELLVRESGRLVAVCLHDVVDGAISAVYTYYAPERRVRGLGVFCVLELVRRAARSELPHLYLGYRVRENASMRYKETYRPHELLVGRPSDCDVPCWMGTDPLP